MVFDGNYKIDVDEVLYVIMDLPDELSDIANNTPGIARLNLDTDMERALLWYENQQYFFQNFESRKLLSHKNVIFYDNQTFDRLIQDAFIIDNVVNAVYKNGRSTFCPIPMPIRSSACTISTRKPPMKSSRSLQGTRILPSPTKTGLLNDPIRSSGNM